MNRVCLMGRLTSDPELRQTASGISSCSFNIAVDRGFKDQNGERQTDFISCTAWRQTAEFICRYFSKGKMIGIEGALRTRNYDDKRYPDVKHYVTEVLVDHAYFGENSGKSTAAAPAAKQTPTPAPTVAAADLSDFEEVVSDSDLPF